ncbi:transcriptional regulator, TetR family [Mycolicibacterium fluoranthenivorans]|jgi:TetR/AcrR family transcriptional regulator|uniref:Transcriptional regulator, TetR family n=2 Tax=Mycolicibacterium fluoranthenivorans TaxID=258505 RepID=A0A1G4WZM8_9MYCO|nr:transcriptional regulator, TetR family [Mycolicibacterium fluoranthenivorans]
MILAAARAEFAQCGLAGARIDRIARTAQASKERLYAHFGDKKTLFREVLAADSAEFFRAISLRRGTVPDFVGDVYDVARDHPEHLRMITWARLEGFALDEPLANDEPVFADSIAAIEAAQAAGHGDRTWEPTDLIALLLAIGMAWATSPHPDASTDDPAIIARRGAGAVEAAARIIAAPR